MAKNEKPTNIVKRAAKTVTKHVNVKKASRTLDKIVEEEAPRQTPPKATFGGLRIAGAVLALGAALVACKPDTAPSGPAPATAVATCEEDQSWCWDCSTMGNRRCGNEDGAVQR